jgi:hypothetical protein
MTTIMAFRLASVVTAINVLVASGFSMVFVVGLEECRALTHLQTKPLFPSAPKRVAS